MTLKSPEITEFLHAYDKGLLDDLLEDMMRPDQITAEGNLTKQAVDDIIMSLTLASREMAKMNDLDDLSNPARKELCKVMGLVHTAQLAATDVQTYLKFGKREK